MPELFAFLGRDDHDAARLLAYATCHAADRPTLLLPAGRRWWTPTLADLHHKAALAGVTARCVTDGTIGVPGAGLAAWNVTDEIVGRLARDGGRLVLLDDPDEHADVAKVRDRALARGVQVLTVDVLGDPLVDAELALQATATPPLLWQLHLDRDEIDDLVEHVLPFAAATGELAGIDLHVEDGRRVWTARANDTQVRFVGGPGGPGDDLTIALPPRVVALAAGGIGPVTIGICADAGPALIVDVDGEVATCTALPPDRTLGLHPDELGPADVVLDTPARLRDRLDVLLRATCGDPVVTLEFDGGVLRLTAGGTGEPPLQVEVAVGEQTPPPRPAVAITVDGLRLARALRAAPAGRCELSFDGGDRLRVVAPGWHLDLHRHDPDREQRAELGRLLTQLPGVHADPFGDRFAIEVPDGTVVVDLDADRDQVLLIAHQPVHHVPALGRAQWIETVAVEHPAIGIRDGGEFIVFTAAVETADLTPQRIQRGLCRLTAAIAALPGYREVHTAR